MGRDRFEPKAPTRKALASRPDNRQCDYCKQYVHKTLLAAHLQKKHGIFIKTVTAAAVAAMHIQPLTVAPKVKSAQAFTKKAKTESPSERKRREKKELFREIDRMNFPPGARLTTNSSGRIPRGGGFMSDRSKF
jgi:hypothetical protein